MITRKDITGQRFARLVVIKRAGSQGKSLYINYDHGLEYEIILYIGVYNPFMAPELLGAKDDN